MGVATEVAHTNGSLPEVERLLDGCGVTEFRFEPKLRVDKIDERASFANQARPLIGGIDEDKVLMMMEALDQHGRDVLPPILVKQLAGGRFKILNGNHRYQAWKLYGCETFPAYVVSHKSLTPQQESVLIYTANIGLGTETLLTERVRQAISLVEQFGITQVDAARLLQIPAAKVHSYHAQVSALNRFEMLGLRVQKGTIPLTSVERLASIQSDEVMVEAAKLVAEAKLATDAVSSLVKRINAARSEANKLAIVTQARQELASEVAHTAAGKIAKPPPITKMQALLSRILTFDVEEFYAALDKVTPEQRQDIRQRAAQAIERLKVVAAP